MAAMNPRARWLGALLAAALALPALVLAFLLLDFRAASGQVNATTSVASTRAPGNAPAPGLVHVFVWVEEKDRLSTAMRDALVRELNATGRFSAHVLPGDAPSADQFPLLRVWIAEPTLSWTPVYATADLRVRFGFSSVSGEISQEETSLLPTPQSADGQFGLYLQGRAEISDRSSGLLSLRGYWRYLGSEIARALSAEMARQVQ